MTLLVITMAFHTYLAALVAKAKKKPLTLMAENSQLFKRVLAWDAPQSPYIKDLKGKEGNSGIYVPPGAAQINVLPNDRRVSEDEPDLSVPEKVNLAGKIIFVLLVFAFNGVFWYIAMSEYTRPSADYLKNDT